MLRRLAGPTVVLSVDVSAAPEAMIVINPSQFDQILLNLLVNARDAMPVGGNARIWPTRSDVDTLPQE